MTSQSHHRPVIWLLLALIALMGVTPPSGLALCIGQDGHVELGLAAAGGDDTEHECPCDSRSLTGQESAEEHEKVLRQGDHSDCGDMQFAALLVRRWLDDDPCSRLPDLCLLLQVTPLLIPAIPGATDALTLERARSLDEHAKRPPRGWLCALRSNVLIL